VLGELAAGCAVDGWLFACCWGAGSVGFGF
jgi:hypothetical protein